MVNPVKKRNIYIQLITEILLLFTFILPGCVQQKEHNQEVISTGIINYAKGFSISYFNDYTEVSVVNPWDTTKILHKYILIDRTKPQPKSLPNGTVIKIPVQNIACLYSLDASVIQTLKKEEKIKAIAETKYVKLPFLIEGLKNGKIIDIGQSMALNIERLMAVSPDIIIVSPFQNMGYGKLETTGISIVENASYMENTPLGRAEWIKFIAAFLDKGKEAEEIMQGIAERYLELKRKTSNVGFRPTVFSEKKYGQSWWVPSGDSYMAHYFKDSGANYVWADTQGNGSLNLNFETVYEKAENADYWLIRSDHHITYDDLKKEFEPYSYFSAWKNKKVIFSNTIENDYYETGVLNPDLVLGNLIGIFHPELNIPSPDNPFFEILK